MPPGGSIRRMIESAVTDLPLPDSPTTPSVPPFSIEKSTPSTARMTPPCVWKPVRRFVDGQELRHGVPPLAPASARRFALPLAFAFRGRRGRGGDRHGDVPLELRQHQLADRASAARRAGHGAPRPSPRGPGRARSGRSRRGSAARSSARSARCASAPRPRSRSRGSGGRPRRAVRRSSAVAACSISQTCLPSSAKSSSVIRSSACDEAVALEREPDRDQDLLHLLVRDAEHDGAAVREGHHEALVLELAERLAHRPAARAELRRERRLDQPLARLVAGP